MASHVYVCQVMIIFKRRSVQAHLVFSSLFNLRPGIFFVSDIFFPLFLLSVHVVAGAVTVRWWAWLGLAGLEWAVLGDWTGQHSIPHIGPLEGKLLQGLDGRLYALEFTRLMARDANYVPQPAGGACVRV